MKGRCIEVSLNYISCYGKTKKHVKKSLPEGMIPPFSRETPLCTCRQGSLTVEAAVILPLLACFFSFFLFFFRIMQTQLVVQQVLENTAERLAIASCMEKEDNNTTFTYLAVAKSLVIKDLYDNENIKRYVTGEVLGISLLGSSVSEDVIFLKADYQMKFPVGLLGKHSFFMHQQAGFRKWTGWHSTEPEAEEDTWVYITDTGQAYHRTSSCTYLDLSITSVSVDKIAQLRNESGQKYRECERCAEKSTGTRLYVTNYGDRYHKDLNCSGIKRTVRKVRFAEAGGRSACTKCWE